MHGQRVGYIRVSSFDQNPERQFEGVAVERLFTDKAFGKDTRRPELDYLLGFVREGDTLVVHSMDRLARNLDDLRRLVQQLTGRGVRVEFVKEHLTFTGEASPMANLMLSVMGRLRNSSAPYNTSRSKSVSAGIFSDGGNGSLHEHTRSGMNKSYQ